MIDLYTWKTPNGRKISIMLEETGLPYTVHPVDIYADAQFAPAFLAISPNNKIPALVDHDTPDGPLSIFESGVILPYLADKSGQFLASSGVRRIRALEWLNWQTAGLGPMLGQLGFFYRAKEKTPAAIERYTKEALRLLGVMDGQLAKGPYLGGDDYSIADIACYPWVAAASTLMAEPLHFESKANIQAWLARVGERPAVKAGMLIPA
ncbi:glutathione S-transferase family protein [Beijerinckia sp. L45]|uniref:glutathione S-transferase family protein n=1 Tax=Beijerinckia sp. L45 TaxID=1641855 RepID=UPI00131B5655|nr:glutathione S-transferase N-terminal domain-containing protein [Beijerinckia sp. L45]